jgi:4-methyl-5(b-hydroxyethyl)-thiazole monophosphate biosynthesis
MVLAEGFEDIEAVAAIDVLNRCGAEVTIASLTPSPVKAAYGNTIVSDTQITHIGDDLYDGIMMPGGTKNAKALAGNDRVVELIRNHHAAGKMVGAICAAPSHVLGEAAGILTGKQATGDPKFNDKLAAAGADVQEVPVMVDGNIITGMGPGAALAWGLMLAEYLYDKQTADSWAEKWQISR